MSKPTINITPLTPRASAQDRSQNISNLVMASGSKNHLNASYSFGLGFLPSFQFNSPRNINMLTSLSPQRFFQVSNNLSKALNGNKKDDKNVFNPNTPSRIPNKFLDSLSSVNRSNEDHDENDESALWSANGSENTNLTSMTMSYDQTPLKMATPKKHKRTNLSQGEFLTPNKLLLHRTDNSIISKKRRLSIEASPNSSIASRLETIASPPRSQRSVTRRSSSTSSSDDKVWNGELDDILISSHLKFKAFKKNNTSDLMILKNVSQNKVLSRMLLNKTGVLRTPKQIASRLFKLTKSMKDRRSSITSNSTMGNLLDHAERTRSSNAVLDESPSLNDEINEIIRTPLEDLIGSAASHIDSISSAEINAQIDKELDLIFSPSDLQVSPFPSAIHNSINGEVNDFQIFYDPTNSNSKHHFIKSHSNSHRSMYLSTESLLNNMKILRNQNDVTSKLSDAIIKNFEQKKLPVYQLSSHINLNMTSQNKFDSLDSVISNSNPLDLDNGKINSFLKLTIGNPENKTMNWMQWKCYSQIFNGDKLLFSANDPVMGYANATNQFEIDLPFLKNFWGGFLSLLINGNDDQNILKSLTILQIIYDNEDMSIGLCLIHRFDKYNKAGNSTIQPLKYTGSKGDLNDLQEVDEEQDEPTQVDLDSSVLRSAQRVNSTEDDNETVLASSSPAKPLDSPARPMRIDLTAAKNHRSAGPASAPIFNPRLVQQMNSGVVKDVSSNGFPVAQHSYSTTDIHSFTQNSFQNQNQNHNQSPPNQPSMPKTYRMPTSTPDINSPYHNSFELSGQRSVSFPDVGVMDLATSTPSKDFSQDQYQGSMMVPGYSSASPNSAMSTTPQGIQSQSYNSMTTATMPVGGRQQLMVNMGNGYVPFNSLPLDLQAKYMGVQRQFQMQHQLNQMLQYQLQQQQQMYQQNTYPQPAQIQTQTQAQAQGQGQNQTHGPPLQNIPMNTMSVPMSAPASQTSFPEHKKSTSKKDNPMSIKFGPMLEYDPLKDSATAAAAAANASARNKNKKAPKPGVSVLDIPRETRVYIYEPSSKKK